jgi:hypothetical protein
LSDAEPPFGGEGLFVPAAVPPLLLRDLATGVLSASFFDDVPALGD